MVEHALLTEINFMFILTQSYSVNPVEAGCVPAKLLEEPACGAFQHLNIESCDVSK